MTFMGLLMFLISSRQGVSEENAFSLLIIISVISLISIILLFVNLLFVMLKDKGLYYKIKSGLVRIFFIIILVVVFLFVNSIYILSKGSLE